MDVKGLLFAIAISIIIVVLLMYFIYGLDMRLMYISDVFFFVGILYFFPGLIVVTGATEILSSIGYLTRRIFSKDKGDGNYFKSFNDYKEYKKDKKHKNSKYNTRFIGINILLVGGVYILASFVISFIV